MLLLVAVVEANNGLLAIPRELLENLDMEGKNLAMVTSGDKIILTMEEADEFEV